MTERKQLEQAIAALEAQRASLGDAAVDAAIAGLRRALAALKKAPDEGFLDVDRENAHESIN